MRNLLLILFIAMAGTSLAQPVISNAQNPIFNKNLIIKDSLTVGDMENDATQNRIMVWDSVNMKINYRQVTTLPSGAGATDLSFSGASSPVTLNSSTGTDVNFVAGTNITLSATGTDLTINSTVTPISEPDKQVVYGTGAGVTSEAGFEYDASTNIADIPNIEINKTSLSATPTEGVWYLEGIPFFHTQTRAGANQTQNRNIYLGNNSGNFNVYTAPSGYAGNIGIGNYTLNNQGVADFNNTMGLNSMQYLTNASGNNNIGSQGQRWNQNGNGNVSMGDGSMYGGAGIYTGSDDNISIGRNGLYDIRSNTDFVISIGAGNTIYGGIGNYMMLFGGGVATDLSAITKSVGFGYGSTPTLSNQFLIGSATTPYDLYLYKQPDNDNTLTRIIGINSSTGKLGYVDAGAIGSGATDLSFSGASSPVTLNSSTGTDVNFVAGTNITLAATGTDLTINSTATTISEPDKQVLYGTGAGVSSSLKLTYGSNTLTILGTGATNKTTLNGDDIIITTDVTDDKVFQVKNDISPLGIITAFTDNFKNGGFSVDSSDGTTIVKLRGGATSHTYFNNKFVSVGRGGESVNHGGFIHGAGLTIGNGTWKRNAATDYSNPDNYMQIISDDNTTSRELGLGWSVSASSETNVGAALVFKATDVFSKGELTGYIKTSNVDAVAPVSVFVMDDDGSFDVSNELNVGNDFTISTDGKISEYGNSTPALGEVLVGDGTSFKKRFVPLMMSPQEGWFAYSEMNGITAYNKGAMDMWGMSAPSSNYNVVSAYSGGISGSVFAGTHTSATGTAMLYSDRQGINLAEGVMVFETSLRLSDSATTAENYNLFFGLTSSQSAPDDAAQWQILFRYSRASVPSRKWEIIVGNGSAQTVYNTGVQWDEDVTYILRVEADRQTAGEVKFYIDGTLVYTATANINGGAMGFIEGIIKTAGTTSRAFYTDYLWAWQRWYTPQTSRGLFESIAGY